MTTAQLSECFDVSKSPLGNVIYIYNNHIDREKDNNSSYHNCITAFMTLFAPS